MIKLSKLYCNKPDIFPDIKFHDGINIVHAAISKHQKQKNTYSHSVGKTTLLEIIDYTLLKEIKGDFFLKVHKNLFLDFEFYLEIQTGKTLFTTIKRKVEGKTFLATHTEPLDARNYSSDFWIEKNLGIKKAKQKLSSIVTLEILQKISSDYRQGLRYCIRRQGEYSRTFKVKNVTEKDSSWKPYLGALLGINHSTLVEKYELKEHIDKLDAAIKQVEDLSNISSQAIEAEIQIATTRLEELTSLTDNFDFNVADQKDIKHLVHNLDKEISKLNNELYTSEHQIKSINESLQAQFKFDVSTIRNLFDEITLHLPDQLMHTYDELVNINEQLVKDRNKRLKKTKALLEEKQENISNQLAALNKERGILAQQILDEDAFKRYKSLQARISKEEAKIAVLHEKLEKLDATSELKHKLNSASSQQQQLADKISSDSRQSHNEILKSIGKIFSAFVKYATDLDAFLYVDVNKEGNPQFHTKLHDHSSQDKGESFRQIISGCFDLSLLTYYSSQSFYRFSYHDGLLESIADPLKVKVLDLWNKEGIHHGLQLIVTIHDSDIPLLDNGSKMPIDERLIIRKLHDQGDDGRLFKMKAF
ncbi:DUF2326 domain-containing protein [Endozoicomonas sp. ALC020]|uniref:DUF2326 domain-containing protein n=1 Tax=unclassified Endozoicomonas TaxID=2644528 RepID=UPI003BB0E493